MAVESTRAPESVAVVGGGVIGCSLAYRLALEGVSVTLVERERIGAGASGVSAGNVQPVQGPGQEFRIPLGVESLALYRRFLPRIKGESDYDPREQDVYYLYPAVNEQEVDETRAFMADLVDHGLQVEWIGGDEAREMEPRLSRDVIGGLLNRDCMQIDAHRFVTALAKAAQRHGVTIVDSEATGLTDSNGRVSGVRLGDGRTIDCDLVLLAMGAWTGLALADWLGVWLPMGPHSLQKLHLRPAGPRLKTGVRWGGVNIVWRKDGLVHAGSKHDPTGFEARTSEEGKRWLQGQVRTILPGLEFDVAEAIAGCGPSTPEKVPIVGPVPSVDGLYVAVPGTNGFFLCAVIAQILVDLIVGGRRHPYLAHLLPEQALARASRVGTAGRLA